MQLTCENIIEVIQGFSLVEQCDVVREGMLRIATPFTYPNGSNIDLFLRLEKPLFPDSFILSDFGQTADYLTDLHIKPWATKKRRQLLEDVCDILGVEQNAGQLQIRFDAQQIGEFPSFIVRLSQACIRVADLAYTQRIQSAGTFEEEVEEYLEVAHLRYEPEVALLGIYNKEVKIDFRVLGKTVSSLVQTLATSPTNAHSASVEAFRKWHDLSNHHALNQFITLYDSTSKIFRDDDLNRLTKDSLVLSFPQDREQFHEAVAA